MPTELEIAAAERAARQAAPGMGGFSAREIARACLEAAERVRGARTSTIESREPFAGLPEHLHPKSPNT